MRLLHYLKSRTLRFGDKQRIELDHPAVLIGPNNCGKTSAIQALALWSQAVRTWYDVRKDSSAKERTATSLNRLNIVAVPVTRTLLLAQHPGAQGQQRHPHDLTVGGAQRAGAAAPDALSQPGRRTRVLHRTNPSSPIWS
jgi:hypothetical protein